MIDDFKPPINERTTDELLQIVGSEEERSPKAVHLAKNELIIRRVDPIKIKTSKYLSKKTKRINKNIKANESYQILDFIFAPILTLFEILFSWELKKDGFTHKTKQQKKLELLSELLF